ncbi:MAG TPA: hypothetical protein VGG72_03145 [Bryobacteraceae bacterium]|jgi:hypothetical protein
MNSVFGATVVLGGMALLSVPAVAQRGGGAPVPEGCAPQPEWQVKSLADFQEALNKERGITPGQQAGGGGRGRGGAGGAAAAGGGAAGGAAAAGGGGRAGGGGGRGGGGRGRGGAAAADLPPVPRIPNEPQYGVQAGKPDFGGLAKGVWNVPYVINMQSSGRDPKGCPVIVPFKPAALALWEDRELKNQEAGDPESFCLPPGVPRMMYTPYPAQIYQMPDRIVMVFEGGAHVWRLIWMDGRELPKSSDDINPDYLGYSVGHWEGDTLVVNSMGFNHQTWLDASGHPHGEKLKVTERYTRTNFNTIQLAATIDDPDYYTEPWTTVTQITWTANTHGPWSMRGGELMEYICQENNRDLSHLGEKSKAVDTR